MRHIHRPSFALILLLTGCGADEKGAAAFGGSSATTLGGSTASSSGGQSRGGGGAVGGVLNGAGGSPAAVGGGTSSATASGGANTGGASSAVGGMATGGATTGGTAAGGGKATGGATTGGTIGLGGQATGGGKATGGATTGGTIGLGGQATGGGKATGGATTGGTTASGGQATGGQGTAGSGCGVAPVSPNPTASATKLLCYLYQIYGTSVLSGQHGTVTNIVSMTGKYPAILGQDFLVDNATNSLNYWNAGGIPLIRYHMGAPPAADSYDSSMSSTNYANVLTPGTAEHTSLLQKLDKAAAFLQTLETAGAPVLWAPFHEVQANGWFWWSKGTGQQFIQLWRLAFDYLTTTKGLNNLIWLLPYSGSPSAAYYPGKAYVDIAGADTYGTNQPFTSMFSAMRNIVGTAMPIPLHETGTIPNPDNMFNSNAAPWVLFNVWFGYETSANTPAAIQYTYAHSRTITRDELPNLR